MPSSRAFPDESDDAQRGAAEAVARISRWTDAIHEAPGPAEMLERATDAVSEITGFDGTWACRIEPDGHGVVVAATVIGPTDTVVGQLVVPTDLPPEPYRHAPRPAPFFSDDVSAWPSSTVAPPPDGGIDLGEAAWQTYLGRLTDLGVRASIMVPVVVDGGLWGAFMSHHPRRSAVQSAAQAELRLLGVAVGTRLGELVELERARERFELADWVNRILTGVGRSTDMLDGLTADPPALLGLCDATGAVVSIDGRVQVVGTPIPADGLTALVAEARQALRGAGAPAVATPHLADAPRAQLDPAVVSGYLATTLTGDAENLIVWVRPEVRRSVRWVQHQTVGDDVPENLFPGLRGRVEEERGSSEPWTLAQLDAVLDFRAALGDLMMARVQQVARHNRDLTRSNHEFDAFAHAAAHDLKQPIRGIRQFTELFLEENADSLEPDQREPLETVMGLAEKMTHLLDDLMRYAELGESAWTRTPVALRDAVADALELLPPDARTGATVDVADVTFEADPSALRQLLLNLLANGCKYKAPGTVPSITVGLTTLRGTDPGTVLPPTLGDHPGDTPVLFVRDQGIGIDAEHHDRVFGLFRKLHASGPFADGSGAGLALCRRIARRHGGDIWVTSEAGRGSTFSVVMSRSATSA